MKIPTGDNVRAADIKQKGDAIVEVTLGGENPANITTPLGVVKAMPGTNVEFYDNGTIKKLIAVEQEVETPVGTVKVKDKTPITFYESGALGTLNPAGDKEFTQRIDLPPLNGVELSQSTSMSFYENGKVQRAYLNGLGQTLQTPIGEMKLKQRYNDSVDSLSYIEYYKSGSPKTMCARGGFVLTINGREYGCNGFLASWSSFLFYPIEFYDSGNADEWLVKSIV